ncbi:hypothetical protein [Herbidospora daliensis]|uniref:hypothetical protein n=1 Tax=Herbidospora daliensis TaxID=295585 RepID=UPI0007807907|nr:hypothetical protein [Herbidospora daliensis]
MPNQFVRRPIARRIRRWIPPTEPVPPPLAAITGSGGVVIGGSATISAAHRVAAITGSGGVVVGGTANPGFKHGPQVPSNVRLTWDFDNDGDFDQPVEDITPLVQSLETFTGRDWPSQLTGSASAGRLRAMLNNSGNWFNYFQQDSPLNQDPFSLHTGRLLRLRVSEATDSPDSTLLARDRFRRADSTSLGFEEEGATWVQPLSDDFRITSEMAAATGEGDPHLAVVDIGAADYYLQALIAGLGSLTNRVGLCYRYVDSNDYSLAVISASAKSLQLIDVVSGVENGRGSVSIEVYSGVTLGVLLSSTSVTAYVDGIPYLTATAPNTSSTTAGIYARWGSTDIRPVFDNFYAWDRLPVAVDGILWTGDVADVVPSVMPGPQRVASLSGEGWLANMAALQVTPPTSITGRKTGQLLGAVLAECLLLHPPGPIAPGDVTTGPFAMRSTTARAVARAIEEAEFGFLYELPEGPIAFESRSARDASTAVVTFSDEPGAQFGYIDVTPQDWRREVFNRVVAGVSPYAIEDEAVLYTDPGPYVLAEGESVTLAASYRGQGVVTAWTGHSRSISAPLAPSGVSLAGITTTFATEFQVPLPDATDAGDLILVAALMRNWDGSTPSGWELISAEGDDALPIYIYCIFARVCDGEEEPGDTLDLGITPGGDLNGVAHIYHITDWYGDIDDGIQCTPTLFSQAVNPNPPAISPAWGAVPTLFIAVGGSTNLAFSGTPVLNSYPSSYSNGVFTRQPSSVLGWIASATRVGVATTENPGTFSVNSAAVANSVLSVTIAVRGSTAPIPVTGETPAGTNGTFTIAYDDEIGGDYQSHTNIQVSGIVLAPGDDISVQSDDVESQERHRSIRSYRTSSALFANSADALEYAGRVLTRHSTDRPIVAISFIATKSAAYRAQAKLRRVGDRIRLIANYNSGLGVDQDFFIESIGHAFSDGLRKWVVIWELSPAPP